MISESWSPIDSDTREIHNCNARRELLLSNERSRSPALAGIRSRNLALSRPEITAPFAKIVAEKNGLRPQMERACSSIELIGRTTIVREGITISAGLNEISRILDRAAAIAKGAVACAEAGSEREALQIAMDLDRLLGDASSLHGAVCLLGRMARDRSTAPEP